MVYYAKNKKTGKIITNTKPYSYAGKMTLAEFNRICHVYRSDLEYYGEYNNGVFTNDHAEYRRFVSQEESGDKLLRLDGEYKPVDPKQADNYEIAFAFKDSYTAQVTKTYRTYTASELRRFLAFVITGLGVAGLACLLFIFRLINRKGILM